MVSQVGLSSSDRGRAVAAPQVISRSQIHQESDEDDAGEETAAGAYTADDAESEEDEEELLARREAVRQRCVQPEMTAQPALALPAVPAPELQGWPALITVRLQVKAATGGRGYCGRSWRRGEVGRGRVLGVRDRYR